MRIAILDLVQVRVGIMLHFAFTFHISHYTLHKPAVCFVESTVPWMGACAPVFLAAVMEVGSQ